jgi:hypothetical protein
MPVFVEVTPDPFASSFRNLAVGDPNEEGSRPGSGRSRAIGTFDHVRRPVRGIQIKEDTYATIQVRTADGRNIPLIDAGGAKIDESNPDFAYTDQYSNFLLQAIQEERTEKMQVVQTFGEPFVFFFGESPRLIAGSGILLNTEDFNWRAEFLENYDKYLRGTKCVQSKTRVTLSWDDIVVEGYFIKVSISDTADNNNFVRMEFQMFLTNYQNVSRIGFSQFPRDSVEIDLDPNDVDTTGEGIGNLKSQTQLVRSLNTQSLGVKNSMLQTIRDNINKTLTIDGKLTSVLQLASQFTSGRNIRVPFGFAGGSIFDQETQIALASVDATGRLIYLRSQLGDQSFEIKDFLRSKTISAKYGRIQDNLDEYIARIQAQVGNAINPPDLFASQKLQETEIDQKVREVFEKFGVDVEPPDEMTLLARRAAFGFFSVLVGSVPNQGFQSGLTSLREFVNAAPI